GNGAEPDRVRTLRKGRPGGAGGDAVRGKAGQTGRVLPGTGGRIVRADAGRRLGGGGALAGPGGRDGLGAERLAVGEDAGGAGGQGVLGRRAPRARASESAKTQAAPARTRLTPCSPQAPALRGSAITRGRWMSRPKRRYIRVSRRAAATSSTPLSTARPAAIWQAPVAQAQKSCDGGSQTGTIAAVKRA